MASQSWKGVEAEVSSFEGFSRGGSTCAYSVFYRRLRSYASVLLASIDSYFTTGVSLGLAGWDSHTGVQSPTLELRVALQFVCARPGVFGQ
eukprot:scaffold19195_cov59-Phaeocystis_antarctica.AAC.3